MNGRAGKRNCAGSRSLLMATVVLGALATSNAWAEPAHVRLVGYAGQVNTGINGQHPIGFRFFDDVDRGALVYEETLTADVRQGRILVYVGRRRGDMTEVLRQSRRMEVYFQGRKLESLPVIRTTRAELTRTWNDSSPIRAIWLAEDEIATEYEPAASCRLLTSGIFTAPFTHQVSSALTPGCAASEFAISAGYNFLTRPSQGVIAMSLFFVAPTNWQLNFEVRSIPATLEVSTLCCSP